MRAPDAAARTTSPRWRSCWRCRPLAVVAARVRGDAAAAWSWHFFFLGAGFMLLETKSIVQFALLWGSTWSSASLAIASVLVMALASALVVSRVGSAAAG